MKIDSPLPPHLQQFVREELAAGRYQSESDVIQTALALLEAKSQETMRTWLKQELDRGFESKPSEPATKQFWDQLRDRLRAGQPSANDA